MQAPLISYVAMGSSLVPVAIGYFRFRRLSFAMKLFLGYCIVASAQIAGEYWLALHHMPNAFLANLGLGLEPFYFCIVYAVALGDGSPRRLVLLAGLCYGLFWVPERILHEIPSPQIDETVGIVSRIAIVAMSAIALHNTARRTTTLLTDEPLFWVTTANLVAATGVVFVIVEGNELLQMGMHYFQAAWELNWSLLMLSNLLYSRGFFCKTSSAILSGP
ncbi:MAG TPA: hypothetical protein VMG34_06510 [Bacteroidota bacterium]|nr:hypothetical protein [Bacteroidota bacterium]